MYMLKNKPHHLIIFILNSSQLVLVCKNIAGACTVYSMPKAPLCEYVCACVCVQIFAETIGPTEAKLNVEPQWDRGRKCIQMIPVICCSSFEYCQPLGAGAFRRAFTTNVTPQCRAFSRALEIEKFKDPLFRGPEGAADTNDWCIICTFDIYPVHACRRPQLDGFKGR